MPSEAKMAETAMDPTELNAAELLKNLHTGVVVHDASTAIVYANPRALELMRLSEQQAAGKDAFDPEWRFLDHLGRPMPNADYPVNQVLSQRAPVRNLEVGVVDSSGRHTTWVLCNAYPEWADDGSLSRVVVTFIDITQQKKRIPFEGIVELANDMVLVMEPQPQPADYHWRIVYTNEAFSRKMGYSREDVYGQSPEMLHDESTDAALLERLRYGMANHETMREQIRKRAKDGQRYWIDINLFPMRNAFGDVTFYAAIERDVTNMKEAEEKLHSLSVHDHLTGLYNRRGFEELAAQAIKHARRHGETLSFAMVDIDHFKRVNDTYGHATGDFVLSRLASLLGESFRESDILARLGGEEFGVLMLKTPGDNAMEKLERFRRCVGETTLSETPNGPLRLTISAGLVSTEPTLLEAGIEQVIPTILQGADEALYKAKRSGRNQIVRAD